MTDRPGKPLGFWSLLALGLNGVVGVGIFFLPARLGELTPGWAGVGVLVATAGACLPVALTFAALARCFDEDGGPAVYARAAFGHTAAFVVGWVAYLSAVASTAAVIAGLTRYSVAAWWGLGPVAERGAAMGLALALFG
ncbi:MAG: amino acid permease, partial [Myxococcales bacterium]